MVFSQIYKPKFDGRNRAVQNLMAEPLGPVLLDEFVGIQPFAEQCDFYLKKTCAFKNRNALQRRSLSRGIAVIADQHFLGHATQDSRMTFR
ncbi:hypothetical protein D3C74_283040 [compost metagenome]